MYGKVHYWCIKECPLYRGYSYCVLYSECPLSEVPLYTEVARIVYNLLGRGGSGG